MPHPVPAATLPHAPPEHVFVVPHAVPPPLQLGSIVPLATMKQVPRLPGTLHALHAPQLLPCASEQHTPSMHLPVLHSAPFWQLTPASLRPQVIWPLMSVHALPPAHCAADVHIVKHEFVSGLHLNVPHENASPAEHVPLPLQTGAFVPAFAFAAQLALPQILPAGWTRQAPDPLQKPSLPQPAVSGMQRPSGSSSPLPTALQVPVAHVMHVPEQAVAQQTFSPLPASTQLPFVHSALPEHVAPSGFVPQLLALHDAGGKHAAFVAHEL